MPGVQVERRDHLGIVAGVGQEIGLAAYWDGLAGPSGRQVSIGMATVTMMLNGLGFSNRLAEHRLRATGRDGAGRTVPQPAQQADRSPGDALAVFSALTASA